MTNFNCMDCGIDTGAVEEYYMLRPDVWERIVPDDKGMLCLECAENRLGRRLEYSDFWGDAALNEIQAEVCEKLRVRLNRNRPASAIFRTGLLEKITGITRSPDDPRKLVYPAL